MEEKIKIYIDDDGDRVFAEDLKKKILSRFKNTFEVNDFGFFNEERLDLEDVVLKAAEYSDIIIPILSSGYLSFLEEEIEQKFNEVISSKDKHLLPIYYKKSNWSSRDWVVRSKVIPDGETSFSDLKKEEKEIVYHTFYDALEKIAASLQKKDEKEEDPIPTPEIIEKEKMVFISYDRNDGDFAQLMALQLEKSGIKSWVDTNELDVGTSWREEIDKGIQKSAAIIVIMSPEARKSEYVTYEWAYAWGRGMKVIPIMIKQTTLHARLQSLQYMDFTDRSKRPWDKLIQSIMKL